MTKKTSRLGDGVSTDTLNEKETAELAAKNKNAQPAVDDELVGSGDDESGRVDESDADEDVISLGFAAFT
jgi:hypothetical protein